MTESQADLHSRLTRYLSGGCSAAEAAELERWLKTEPAAQAQLDTFRKLWEASAGLPPADRVDEMWGDLARRIRGEAAVRPSPDADSLPEQEAVFARPRNEFTLHRARRGGRRRWRAVWATAAGLVAAVAYGAREYRVRSVVPATAATGSASVGAVREYRTQRGQRGTIQLNDGTRIELGVASVLRVYPFTDRRRDVELDGEAIFDVVHDPVRPFTVRSRNTLVEDLGTRFGVRAYRGDARVRVVVAQGKVALRPGGARPDTTTMLVPGELGTIDASGRTQIRRVAAEEYFGWAAGRLLFDNAALADVAADLERWYDVTVTILPPALADRRVTLSIPIGALTDALDAVTAPLGLAYEQHGSTVVLRAK